MPKIEPRKPSRGELFNKARKERDGIWTHIQLSNGKTQRIFIPKPNNKRHDFEHGQLLHGPAKPR